MGSEPVKAKASKKPKAKATKELPVPEFYRRQTPTEPGRASIEIGHEDGKMTATASLPAQHLPFATGLVVGLSAVAAPSVTVGIAAQWNLPPSTVITVTALAAGVSVLALLWLFYMFTRPSNTDKI
ncbi:hypothetical protein [Nocardia gipuzkoensis]